MSESWRAPGGWTVEIVQLSQTPDNHDGSWIRLRLNGFFVADVATVAELAEWIDVADLEPGGLTLLVKMTGRCRGAYGLPGRLIKCARPPPASSPPGQVPACSLETTLSRDSTMAAAVPVGYWLAASGGSSRAAGGAASIHADMPPSDESVRLYLYTTPVDVNAEKRDVRRVMPTATTLEIRSGRSSCFKRHECGCRGRI
jgi:hypothetical protein